MRARPVAALLAGALLLAGCTSGDKPEDAVGGLFGGGKVEVMYAFSGSQAAGFRDAVGTWAQRHSVTVTYTHSDDLAGDLAARRHGGTLPDVVIAPQPGLLRELHQQGVTTTLDDVLPVDRVASDLVPGLMPPLRDGDATFGIPVAMNVKSLLWYDRHALHARDIDPPQTMPELVAAAAKLRASGRTAWCLGLADGVRSGWAGTDWVEELVLKQAGPQVYDQWASGQVAFSDPRVKAAFATYAALVRAPRGVEGGGAGAAARDVRKAADGMFADPQRCSLLKQGSYATQQGFMPERVRQHLDETASVVSFPTGSAATMEVGGDSAALVRGGDDSARGLVRYMATDPRFGADWAGSEDRGFISPRTDFALDRYASTTTRKIAAAAYAARTVRFDASDQMPPAVGQKAFWPAMVDLTAGRATVDQVVARLDAARRG